jgi:antitoxin component of RelBE/YafQ-DinJ toxin-antitoxin module
MYSTRANIVRTVKKSWLQIRINDDIKKDLKIVAELRGLSASALLHSIIVRMIREEKILSPEAFKARRPDPPQEIDQDVLFSRSASGTIEAPRDVVGFNDVIEPKKKRPHKGQ